MSKTTQRKKSLEALGRSDALNKQPFRYKRNGWPLLKYYEKGYRSVKRDY